jgi:hypothetical protein
MQEYNLSPDELIDKAFRIIQSSRRGYYPNGKSEWIAAVKNVHKRDGNVFAGYLQHKYMSKASGFSVIGIRLCVLPDLNPTKCESVAELVD